MYIVTFVSHVNVQGGFHGNALHAAAFGGHETIVNLLLQKCADVNVQGGLYGNSLQAAASSNVNIFLNFELDLSGLV